jgi:hypothetical protein
VSQRKEKVCCNVSYKNKIYNNTNRYMTYIWGSHHDILTIILVNKNFDDDNDYNNLILSEVEDLHLLLMHASFISILFNLPAKWLEDCEDGFTL